MLERQMIYFTHPSAFNDPFEMEPYFALPELDPKTGAASPASFGSVLKAGGALKLLKVSSRNHDLLSITRLVTVLSPSTPTLKPSRASSRSPLHPCRDSGCPPEAGSILRLPCRNLM